MAEKVYTRTAVDRARARVLRMVVGVISVLPNVEQMVLRLNPPSGLITLSEVREQASAALALRVRKTKRKRARKGK